MKKLNRKGFTLIELLAVIVVLAIIMVIAIPTVLNTTAGTAKSSFVASATRIAGFIKDQNQIKIADATGGSNETCYNTWIGTLTNPSNLKLDNNGTDANCWGINNNDYELAYSEASIDANGVVTLTLCPKNNGKFKTITGSHSDASQTSVVSGGTTISNCYKVTK